MYITKNAIHISYITQSVKKYIQFNIIYRREMKLVPTNMGYCLLQFNASKVFLGIRLLGGNTSNFPFFNVISII